MMQALHRLLPLLLLALIGLPTGCQQPVETALSGDTQGTTWHLKMVLDGVAVKPDNAAQYQHTGAIIRDWGEA
ncbi:MAG TPA: hypothetical protein PLY96_13895, partial [Chromatiaceae bacterium]|nr:hypothetical protein [Chromatiaceae bacterium]